MFANAQLGGTDLASPDVCLTPAGKVLVPMVYPNQASGAMGMPGVSNVLFQYSPAHNLSTVIPTSQGDEPGVAGVASGSVMGPSRHLTGAFTVLVGGMPATRLGSKTMQNGGNCSGTRMVPSQTKVLLLAP